MSTVTLSISNLDQLQHDVNARHRFDHKGGTIGSGRATWRINDRDEAIAPIHCEIRWIEGSFCVIDHCHRTYMNDSSTSLGSLPPRRLVDGDQLCIGAYRLQVRHAQDLAGTHSLAGLFNPECRTLDSLIAEEPATPWRVRPCAPQAAVEICSVFKAAMGNDPLAALDAAADAGAPAASPLQSLIAGERP
ncbi:MAG: FHA domain-containing protein [Candidatus Pseudomonas phytovorans]|uniref:FHA domain-containing protein n=1 Tax=Candidatus Pseudomonas phytovorans TaxID=3121377 RepID=A0AAJ6B856_9PSED|nr:FHA domain-containing protein [Pseudomonas sp.]WEK28025.1 MAG: FHA domain-containing protein [Pseudomonas sp.]